MGTSSLPTIQARHLRTGLTDYLATTFALTDPDARAALADFIGDPATGMFKGPYVRLRLPFAPAASNWRLHLDWYEGPPPYGHQARAFERLSTKHQDRPQRTLVTTGTGSGKTEAFLIPILDHVLRAKRAGVTGMKAVILYPMNALANDQAERLTRFLTQHPELSGVTAGLYTGEQTSRRTLVTEDGLITDRGIMQQSPPDILLTNYKMLDQLLLRTADADMWRLSADSLQYIVLDEFHTYDGAQGTDVAMLLRRLGYTLKSHWTGDSPATDDDRIRPLGRITPVATSATLGTPADTDADPSDNSPSVDSSAAMLDFAHTVFGEQFTPDAVIGETRLTPDQWLADRTTALDRDYSAIEPSITEAVANITAAVDTASTAGRDIATAITRAMLAELYERSDSGTRPTDVELKFLVTDDHLLDLIKGHPLLRAVLTHAADAIALADLANLVLPTPVTPTDTAATRQRFLEYFFALLSHVRATVGPAALNVDVHLWIRELSRIDRAVRATAAYRWSDDGVTTDTDELYLPAVHCRHCGRSGWGARLAPTGYTLDVTDDAIRSDHAGGGSRFRALLSAPAEAHLNASDGTEILGLRWFHSTHREILDTAPDPEDEDSVEGRVLPVIVLSGPDADEESKDDVCPACGAKDGIRFMGSAIATQLSVTLSNLFGDKDLHTAEKKALMFTDSVQDAAHRAGFVQARSHSLSLRSALRGALDAGDLDLTELCTQLITDAGTDPMRRYQLLAPDIVDRGEFTAFWDRGAHHNSRKAAERKAKRRLQFDIDLEFGLQSRVGRTLELTGAVAAEVYLGAPGRAATLGRLAADVAAGAQLQLTAPTDEQLTRWVRGTVERVRTQGGITHEWLRRYIEKDANRYHVWGGRPRGEGMPAFPKGRPAPTFPALGGTNRPAGTRELSEGFDPITNPNSWYARWASRCLDVSPYDGTFLAKALFTVLADQRVLETRGTERGATVYGLAPTTIQLTAPSLVTLENNRHLLVCDVCRAQVPGSVTVVDELDGAGCLLVRCPGTLRRAPRGDNFYRSLYDSTQMKRVVAREHTSMLTAEERHKYESGFKHAADDPQAPNVLVATPTLEMGIDIGDLSTVMLGSLPRSVSSYLQRVGRAGRATGNSLVLAYVRGRGEHLPKLFEPLSVIQGEVRPPATLLNAEEILQRQYVAYLIDGFARDPQRVAPRDARTVLGSFDEDTWMGQLIEHAYADAGPLIHGFIGQFGDVLSDESRARLVDWVGHMGSEPTLLTKHLQAAVHRWNRDLAELTERRATIDAQLPELEKRVDSPAATDDDRRALRTALGSRKLLGGQINSITSDYWISVLERYGVLPNYTLLDDAVTLDVGVTWIDPDTSEFKGDALSYQRGSRVALTELAPGSTFYAQGLAVKIDAVDLGTGESAIHTWQICPQCGWVKDTAAGADPQPVSTCPRCSSPAIADVSQRLPVVEMTKVSAEVKRDEASITDARDERTREQYTITVAADLDPAHVGRAWFVDADSDVGVGARRGTGLFGAEYLRRLDIRWLNLGRSNSQGSKRIIAGQESSTGLFRVCASCGQLDKAAGRNSRYEHRPWCRHRTAATEDVREIALARTLSTQGVLLHLPPQLEYDNFAHPSLSAAILLGLREVIGGSPEHLDVAIISDALRAPDRRALLLHDTVPGGTGYLAEFADPAKVWAVLAAARKILRDCPCRTEERLACHRCLLPFAPYHDLDKTSRVTALKALDDILGVRGAHGEPDFADWRITEEPPPAPPASDESFLEKDFYTTLIERLKTMGASVVEKPGTYGPSATITMPGDPVRRWTLKPQVALGYVKPDFLLTTGGLDEVVIFTDGRTFHATSAHNSVTDDAEKRAKLRAEGYVVWAVTAEDLKRFKAGEKATPPWFDDHAADFIKTQFHVRPGAVNLLAADAVTQLVEFIAEPDLDAWRQLSRRLPYLLLRTSNRVASSAASRGASALRLLDGEPPFTDQGSDPCWSYADGPVAVTAAVTSRSDRTVSAVLGLDNREEALESFDGRGWRDWLRLSNWLGLSEHHRIVTRELLESDSGIDSGAGTSAPARQPLSGKWNALLGDAVSEAERELVRMLADMPGVPVPEIGYEADDGSVFTVAWPDTHVGVVLADDYDADHTINGWTICSDDAAQITTVLTSKGVM